jgi:hypothetical protein
LKTSFANDYGHCHGEQCLKQGRMGMAIGIGFFWHARARESLCQSPLYGHGDWQSFPPMAIAQARAMLSSQHIHLQAKAKAHTPSVEEWP